MYALIDQQVPELLYDDIVPLRTNALALSALVRVNIVRRNAEVRTEQIARPEIFIH